MRYLGTVRPTWSYRTGAVVGQYLHLDLLVSEGDTTHHVFTI